MQASVTGDDDLLRAIADNTNGLSALIEQEMQLDGGLGALDPDHRAKLMLFNVQLISAYQRDYRRLTNEVRRRYSVV